MWFRSRDSTTLLDVNVRLRECNIYIFFLSLSLVTMAEVMTIKESQLIKTDRAKGVGAFSEGDLEGGQGPTRSKNSTILVCQIKWCYSFFVTSFFFPFYPLCSPLLSLHLFLPLRHTRRDLRMISRLHLRDAYE